jgi:predicted dehydrogenase
MNGVLRTAIVGAGWWSGRIHVPAILADPRAELTVICDPDGGRAERMAAAFNVPHWTTSTADVLDMGVDCAVVASPHHTHFAAALPLVEAGIDVMVEKPMTVEPEDAWLLVEAARKHGARLHVGYSFLHSRHAQRLRRLLEEGGLGEAVFSEALFATAVHSFYRGDMSVQLAEGARFQSNPSTYSDPRMGGGHLQAQATHALSLIMWIFSQQASTVSAKTSSRPYGTVDVSDSISMELDDGVLATIAATGMAPLHDLRIERCTVFGTEAYAELDAVAQTLTVRRAQAAPLVLVSKEEGSANPLGKPVEMLIRCRLTGEEPPVSGEFGAAVVDATWAAFQSASTGQDVSAKAWRSGS